MNNNAQRNQGARPQLLALLLALLFLGGCSEPQAPPLSEAKSDNDIGILLLNHGSRSERWKQNLLDLERNVSERLLAIDGIDGVRTAFMEHASPSIADALESFDREGYRRIVVIPVFLTIGTHMFDDIPTIIGMKDNPESIENLKLEGIERYTPKAETHLAPSLDFSDLLKHNTLRRTKALSENPEQEGLVLVGYGSTRFDDQWSELFDEVGSYVCRETGIPDFTTAWCGHIANYSPGSTTAAINRALETSRQAIVIPLLVSHSEQFQAEIIGGGVAAVENHRERVRYKPDAILPDPELEEWVIGTARSYADQLRLSP